MEFTQSLANIDIFSTLNKREIKQLRALMKHHEIAAGTILFQEGEYGQLMYVILSGEVLISIASSDGEELEIARMGSGDFLGEMSILENVARSATGRTSKSCHLLSLDSQGFHILMQKKPKTAIKIMYRMLHTCTDRLHQTGAFLSDMVKWGKDARIRAVTDDLTGFYNRRFFDEALETQVRQSKKTSAPFILLMVDLDHFGTLNAEYGEKVGDAVLKTVASVFVETFKKNAILTRYGGDEFAFILPQTQGHAALTACQNLKENLSQQDILASYTGAIKTISTSIGLAVFPEHAQDSKSLLEKADQALYKAKEAGRNQAQLYSEK